VRGSSGELGVDVAVPDDLESAGPRRLSMDGVILHAPLASGREERRPTGVGPESVENVGCGGSDAVIGQAVELLASTDQQLDAVGVDTWTS
jgi:hypothetical protein